MSKKPRLGNDPLSFIQDSRQEPEKKTQSQTNAKTLSQTQTFAENIKAKARSGGKSGKLEDSRQRQTYWLDKEEIKMINQIAKRANVSKYKVVSAAVRLLYEYVFNEQEE